MISLLLCPSGIVGAVEENETITDPEGDVYSLDILGLEEGDTSYVTESQDIDVENIDVKEVRYSRDDTQIVVEIEVYGEIEDRGEFFDETDPYAMFYDIDSVGYGFLLQTSDGEQQFEYSIQYTNKKCQIIYPSEFNTINLTENDFYIDNQDTLVVMFELESNNETYLSLDVESTYTKMNLSAEDLYSDDFDDLEGLFVWLTDIAPNPPLEILYGLATNVAEVGKSVQFNGSALFGQPPYEYQWDFGDGSTSTEKNPTHKYSKAGDYEYNLTVTDDGGDSDYITGEITIIAEENGDTPGFELIMVLVAIGLILFWKRRQNN
jgi:hypothetical protein